MKTNTAKKKPGRPSKRKTTLAVLRAMLTVPAEHKGRFLKRKGHYEVERVTLPVNTVAEWLNVSEDTVRCIERGRKGYPLTPERAEIISHQTRVSADWLLECKPKAKPLNWWSHPFTQADFDDQQIALTDNSHESKQGEVSCAFVRIIPVIAGILLLASQKGKLAIYTARLHTVLGETLVTVNALAGWSDTASLPPEMLPMRLCAGRGFKKETLVRPNLDEFLDAYEHLLKKIHPPAI
jgi:hypothetical protein